MAIAQSTSHVTESLERLGHDEIAGLIDEFVRGMAREGYVVEPKFTVKPDGITFAISAKQPKDDEDMPLLSGWSIEATGGIREP